jgi:peptide methionine sulfoxide reductase MsrA
MSRTDSSTAPGVRIVVVVENGLLTAICSDGACAVEAVYIDYDPESIGEERIISRKEVEVDPETVERHFVHSTEGVPRTLQGHRVQEA